MNTRFVLGAVIGIAVPLFAAQAFASPTWGPKTYNRTTGPPKTFAESFSSCESQAQYRLVAVNGMANGDKRVSSATVYLNGAEVLTPKELNQNVNQVAKPISLTPENSLSVELAGTPLGQLTVSIECTANCFSVSIDQPGPGAMVNAQSVFVTGTVNSASGEVGVTVNQTPGYVGGPLNGFAAPDVPLQIGSNTLTAIATNACGQTARAERIVTVQEAGERLVYLLASPPGGIAPVAVNLRAIAAPPHPIAGYSWSFSSSTQSEVAVNYENPGLYLPQVTVTDTKGFTYSATAVVSVLDRAALHQRLLSKWTGMRAALARGDAEGAVAFFTHGSRERYRQIFSATSDQLTQIAAALPDPVQVAFAGLSAQYRVERTHVINGAPQAITYWVYFLQDGDGIWRIKQF